MRSNPSAASNTAPPTTNPTKTSSIECMPRTTLVVVIAPTSKTAKRAGTSRSQLCNDRANIAPMTPNTADDSAAWPLGELIRKLKSSAPQPIKINLRKPIPTAADANANNSVQAALRFPHRAN